jgi:exopolysaccharide biosynthesis polyprenyl glycosylphosphotransferase
LLHVDKPRYQGATKLLKTTFDKVAATLLIVMLAPVMVACAIAIKLDSRGPIFYRAERMGVNNEPFLMWKFRSMVQNADTLRAGLADQNDGNAVLFKMRDDPRVTRVGRFLRRYSLDELPQLFNVIDGSMSLVGPRPPLRDEVESYDATVVRRMLVRPGMTGLWQVSGRSDLTWEDSVQLDLSYVENWSLAADLVILWRTARAVISSNGAY